MVYGFISTTHNIKSGIKKPWMYSVYLNGIKLRYCFCADDVNGIAFCYKTDINGKPCIENKMIVYEVVYGNIEIREESNAAKDKKNLSLPGLLSDSFRSILRHTFKK